MVVWPSAAQKLRESYMIAKTDQATYRRMAELAETDEAIAARHDLYQHRVLEELYDIENDPNCLENLIDNPEYQPELEKLRETLDAWMVETDDHILNVFRNRDDPEVPVGARPPRVTASTWARPPLQGTIRTFAGPSLDSWVRTKVRVA